MALSVFVSQERKNTSIIMCVGLCLGVAATLTLLLLAPFAASFVATTTTTALPRTRRSDTPSTRLAFLPKQKALLSEYHFYKNNINAGWPFIAKVATKLNSQAGTKEEATLPVWFQLFRSTGGNAVTAVGQRSTSVYLSETSTIDDLTKEIKLVWADNLVGVSAPLLTVYPAGTLVPVGNGIDPGDVIPAGTTSKTPLVVVAPAQQPQVDEGRIELAKDFVTAIMQDPVPIEGSEGMSYVRGINLETGKTLDIVIRKCTELFWDACINSAEKLDTRVCALGTPGIGKTTSTAILIRMLLKKDRTVVYLVRTKKELGYYYEFLPAKVGSFTSINVSVYPEKTEYTSIASLKDPLTFYVVDPGKTKDDCCLDNEFIAKFILVSSPDECHWGGSDFQKERGNVPGTFRYYPVWSLEELLEARPTLNLSRERKLTIDEVTQRYREVGGVPRHVFASDDSYPELLTTQDQKIRSLTTEQVEQLVSGNADATETLRKSQPKSAVMVYLADGDNNTFRQAIVDVISSRVAEKISTKFMINNWNAFLDGRKNGPMIFEAYMRALMVKDAAVFKSRSFGARVPCDTVTLGGCTEIRLVSHYVAAPMPDEKNAISLLSQLVAAAKATTAKVLFHSTSKQCPLIDFLYKDEMDHFHAFQVTHGKSHTAQVEYIKKLEALVGDASKLSIYYVVPDFRFKEFTTEPKDPTNPKNGPKALCTIFNVEIPDPNASYRTSTTTAPLGTLSVWFHLHVRTGSNATPVGKPTLVILSEASSISDLKKTVKLNCSANLRGVRRLQVFPPNTISFLGTNALRPGAFVPSSTTDAMPLIVTYLAPRA
jgi:hypothetical protein